MKQLLCFGVCLVSLQTLAQHPAGSISGFVKDASSSPVQGATVQLLGALGDSLIKVAVTDRQGRFELDRLAAGSYRLRISSVGFEYKASDLLTLHGPDSQLQAGEFQLNPAAKTLGEVTVTGRKPLVETKIDKMVVNVDAMISAAGGTALEVLEKSPGVTVDRDGNISLKGKQGVIVLIDGKQTWLGGQDLANYLRNMPTNQLEQIEIMTQPSAKYDASGNSGIINIKTKKNRQAGFNGSVNVSFAQGVYPKSPNSVNLNYKKNKVNLFSSYSYSYWEGFNVLNIVRKFRTGSVIQSVFDQKSDQYYNSNNHNLRVGMDYSISKNTTVGFVLGGTNSNRRNRGVSVSDILDGSGEADSVNLALFNSFEPWRSRTANVNFRRSFDTSGRELTADADFVYYRTRNDQRSSNYTSYPGSTLSDSFLLKGNLPSDIRIYSGRIDYVHPVNKQSRVETGLKSSYVKSDNDARYTIYDEPSKDWIIDRTRSNHFIYSEQIYAAYVNYSRQMKKFGIQTGLRYEKTVAEGKQITSNIPFTLRYAQLFPTAYLSYAMNEKNQFGLSYGRRIERPNYQDMNPFQYFLDQYTYRAGNPYLRPQFSHNIEVSHNYKGQLNTTLNFTRTTNIINDVLKQNDSTKVTFQTRENIAERTNIGLSVNYNHSVTKWWTTSVFVNAFNNHFRGVVNNIPLDADITAFLSSVNNQFRFKKGWGAEASGFYRSRMQEGGVIISEPMGNFSVGGSKQVIKGKGTVRLVLIDPLYLQRFRGSTQFGNIDAQIRNRWDNRRVTVNFSYRFGKPLNGQPRRRAGSIQEEQNRLGTSQQ